MTLRGHISSTKLNGASQKMNRASQKMDGASQKVYKTIIL